VRCRWMIFAVKEVPIQLEKEGMQELFLFIQIKVLAQMKGISCKGIKVLADQLMSKY